MILHLDYEVTKIFEWNLAKWLLHAFDYLNEFKYLLIQKLLGTQHSYAPMTYSTPKQIYTDRQAQAQTNITLAFI